ncbi:MAG: hypothetical protein ACYCSO_08590 [Cuniculiplasma sp.]
MQPEIAKVYSENDSIGDLDRKIPIDHSFFKKDLGNLAISDGWIRSLNFRKTRIRDRSLYFLCLITGQVKLDIAKDRGGYEKDQKESFFVGDEGSLELLERMQGVRTVKMNNSMDQGKRFYFDMTMVELELIKK